MTTIEKTVHFGRGRMTEKKLREGRARAQGRIPRISKLMAMHAWTTMVNFLHRYTR